MEDHATFCRAAADRDRRSAAMNRASAAYRAALAVADNASADAWAALAASDEGAREEAEARAEAARVQARAAWAEWERLRDGGPIALTARSLEDLAATVGPEPTGALAGGDS